MRLFNVKDASGMNLRTSHPQLSEKAVSIERKTLEIKLYLKKEYITSEKVKIIEIIFLFCLPAG